MMYGIILTSLSSYMLEPQWLYLKIRRNSDVYKSKESRVFNRKEEFVAGRHQHLMPSAQRVSRWEQHRPYIKIKRCLIWGTNYFPCRLSFINRLHHHCYRLRCTSVEYGVSIWVHCRKIELLKQRMIYY